MAEEHPRKQPVASGVEKLAILEQRLHAAGDRAHLSPILTFQRWGPRHVAQSLIDGHRAVFAKTCREGSGEIAAEVTAYRYPVKIGANGIAGTRSAYDPRNTSLQTAQPHLVPNVTGF